MFKNRFIGVIAVLAILVVSIAVSFSIIGVFASNPESELERGAFRSANEVGLKEYKQSEWADYRGVPSRVIEEGMAIYHKSERQGVAAPPVRLYNGEPFNAYQRSEWLGAER